MPLQLSPIMRSKSPWSRQRVLQILEKIFTSNHVAAQSSAVVMILYGMACVIYMLLAELCKVMPHVWRGGGQQLCQAGRYIPNAWWAARKVLGSSPGPKSRAKVVTLSHRCRAHVILILFGLMGPAQAGRLGDVRVDPLPAGGSRALQAKLAGDKSTTTSGSNKGPKRAFLRAQTRARTSPLGGTWYIQDGALHHVMNLSKYELATFELHAQLFFRG